MIFCILISFAFCFTKHNNRKILHYEPETSNYQNDYYYDSGFSTMRIFVVIFISIIAFVILIGFVIFFVKICCSKNVYNNITSSPLLNQNNDDAIPPTVQIQNNQEQPSQQQVMNNYSSYQNLYQTQPSMPTYQQPYDQPYQQAYLHPYHEPSNIIYVAPYVPNAPALQPQSSNNYF